MTITADRVFTPDEQEAFTWGDCWLLARAMHNITGWQMVAVGCSGGRADGALRDWVHIAVRTPEGSILDIDGFHTDDETTARWREDFWMVSAEEGDIEVFDVDVDMWNGLTEDQSARYSEIDPSLTAQRLLAYYIEVMVAV